MPRVPHRQDPRVDAYIDKAADFAEPILRHLRGLVHTHVPEATEAIKWGMPTFMYRGKILCHMAAFKGHCAFGFWKGDEVLGRLGTEGEAMGQFGRIESLDDLPSDEVMGRYLALAREVTDGIVGGTKTEPAKKRRTAQALPVPEDLEAALSLNPAARETFERFPPSHRNEYVAWITEAKREETRSRRLAQAVEWLAEGKPRNWRYTGQ